MIKILILLVGLTTLFTGCTDVEADYETDRNISKVTPYVRDLIGARGRDGGKMLKERGYVWIKTEKLDASSYTYWKYEDSGQCLSVETTNGRYVALKKISFFECKKNKK